MQDLKKRVNKIYPQPLATMLIMTVICGGAFLLFFRTDYISIPAIIMYVIWLYFIYEAINLSVIRSRIFKKANFKKKELIPYLEHRLHKEMNKFSFLGKNSSRNPYIGLLKVLISDIKANKVKI